MRPERFDSLILRLLPPDQAAFCRYDIIRDNLDDTPTTAFGYQMMSELGIATSKLTKVVRGDEVMEYIDHLGKFDGLRFNTDGAVDQKVNDRVKFAKLVCGWQDSTSGGL